jgi:hypothetical protein
MPSYPKGKYFEEVRDCRIEILTTKSEKRIIKEKAKALNLSVGDYLRRRGLNYEIVPPSAQVEQDVLTELICQGPNLNQIAKAIHTERLEGKLVIITEEAEQSLGQLQELITRSILKLQKNDRKNYHFP